MLPTSFNSQKSIDPFSFSVPHHMQSHDIIWQRITKSLFIRAYDCPLRLRHALDQRPSSLDHNQYLRILAEGGFQFEKLVRLMWPGESLRATSGSIEDAMGLTLERIGSLTSTGGVLHEAQFVHQAFLARIDMLRVEGKDLVLCEIKAKAATGPVEGVRRGAALTDEDVGILMKRQGGVQSKWVRYVADVAFQTVVVERALRAAGLTDIRVRPHLILANREARGSRFDHFGNLRLRPGQVGSTSARLSETAFECIDKPPADFSTPLVLEVDVEEAVRRLRERSAQSTAESWKSLTLEPLMDEMAAMLSNDGPRAEDERGWKCRDCEFRVTGQDSLGPPETGFIRCWQGLAEQAESLFELYRGGDYLPQYRKPSQRWIHDWLQSGGPTKPVSLGTLPQERRGGTRATARSLQIKSHQTGKTECSEQLSDRVAARLLSPKDSRVLHFIDFETATACLPYEAGMRPYEIIAFQFSSHSAPCANRVIDRAHVRHREWLDPMNGGCGRTLRSVDRTFVDHLRQAIGDSGPVMHWAAHERTVLRTLAARLDPNDDRERLDWLRDLAGETKQDHGRLIDMLSVAEGNVMTPHQQGRYSMKQLLPAACRSDRVWHELCELMDWQHHRAILPNGRDPYRLLPPLRGSPVQSGIDTGGSDDESDLDSATMDSLFGVRCGTDAIRAFQQLRYGSDSTWGGVDTAALRESLLEYCKLDTAAMVAVWVWLTDLAEHADRQ
jgi:hypothetical protein